MGLVALPLVSAEPSLIDRLPQGALQSAFQVLRRDYIRRDELTFEELNRAALQGLIERLHAGASIIATKSDVKAAQPHVHAEFIAPDIAYLRPETLSEGEATLVESELQKIVEKKAKHLILDLRATKLPGSFDEAALALQCFVPSGELIFKMKQIGRDDADLFVSKRNPLWTGRVVVLVDAETSNAAEAVAAVLQNRGRALVIGEPTRGAAVRFTDVKLDESATLRYASAEMMLPDNSTVFKKGVSPAIVAKASMTEKRKVIEGSRGASLKPFILDRVRPRYNEHALVHGGNPEIDDYVKRSKGQPLPGDEGQVRDVVTQRALDLLQVNDFVSASKLPTKPAK